MMSFGICNLCGFPVLRIYAGYFGTRCLNCRSTMISRAAGRVIDSIGFSSAAVVYELSSRGALFRFLRKKFRNLYFSEYYDDVVPGLMKKAVVCQDVQHLLLGDKIFDMVTSTEVFEHVPDDMPGFREIYRVLKSGGYFIFTVPMSENLKTIERCFLQSDGSIIHKLVPEYHGDRIRGQNKVLVFRNYGQDIIARLNNCGFRAEIRVVNSRLNAIKDNRVILARKI